MSDYLVRAQLAKLRMDRLQEEADKAAAAGDLDRLRAIRAESELVLEGLRQVREEQLLSMLPKPRRPWWRRLIGGSDV